MIADRAHFAITVKTNKLLSLGFRAGDRLFVGAPSEDSPYGIYVHNGIAGICDVLCNGRAYDAVGHKPIPEDAVLLGKVIALIREIRHSESPEGLERDTVPLHRKRCLEAVNGGGEPMPTLMTGEICQPDSAALEATRERLNLSKAELCRRLGIRPSTYNGYLQGTAMPVTVQNGIRAMCHDGAPDIWT